MKDKKLYVCLYVSLDVADFLVGFLQRPVEIVLLNSCWIQCDITFVMNNFLAMLIVKLCIRLCWLFASVHTSRQAEFLLWRLCTNQL